MSSLFTSDFPPYTIFPLREGEYYIAGGGGTSKTGVPNALVSELQLPQVLNNARLLHNRGIFVCLEPILFLYHLYPTF